MSFLSFLGSLLPKCFFANNNQPNQTDETDEDGTIMEQSAEFPLFLRLPTELRHMIIEQALYEHEVETYRVVLIDPRMRRIFPTKELAAMTCSLLFVNTEFRSLALKIYTKVDVFDLGSPADGQYGRESRWYMEPLNSEYLVYSRGVPDQMEEELEDQSVHKGCLYINPEKDIFITGIIPRQVALTNAFRSELDGTNQSWKIPRDCVTEKLQENTCASITTIRELEWDVDDKCIGCGTCLNCGRRSRACCLEDFFDKRGSDWVPFHSLFHSRAFFTGVKSFGFYLLTAGDDMQQFFHNLTIMGGKACLEEEWDKKYLEFDLSRLQE